MNVQIHRSTIQAVSAHLNDLKSRMEQAKETVFKHFRDKGEMDALHGGESGRPVGIVQDVHHYSSEVQKAQNSLEKAKSVLGLMGNFQPMEIDTITMSVEEAHTLLVSPVNGKLANDIRAFEERVAELNSHDDAPLANGGYRSPAASLQS